MPQQSLHPSASMKDIQGQRDYRRINIKKVGVKNISYPIRVLDKSRKTQKTIATVNMYVNLPHQFKGTHMSRFIEILNRFHGEINLESFHLILEEMKQRLQAEEAHMEIDFPYFLKKNPSSGGAMDLGEYRCRMHGSLDGSDDLTLGIQVPVSPPAPTPPGPARADRGLPRSLGHWGTADICLRFRHFIWIEDVIQIIEGVLPQGGGGTDPVPGAATNSLSVEKITKDLGEKFTGHPEISWFSIRVENLSEGFSTFAAMEWPESAPP